MGQNHFDVLVARLTCEVQHSKRVCTSFILFVSVH